ncbi:hypothetical protein KPL76_12815 [Subtercola sp. PAMC28395]|uniref:hypothetical protein n=1 Tax=Subtercola sp. PAMC28395 TaxID=2846775 RepID=UPI001C0C7A52|nr:hypothetical protein [Subtercola sp. PAMC28395]QWT23572.1 hypothetical protein KPL76_12815 [Subtercola sp. PAMC28395]
MSDEIGSADSETGPSLQRRQLLKAGAWAVPVIAVAAASPAARASNNGIVLVFNHLAAWYLWTGGDKTGMGMSTSVQATGSGTSTGDVTVTITTDSAGLLPVAPIFESPSTGWSNVSQGINGTKIAFTFLWPGPLPLYASTIELRFALTGDGTKLNETPKKEVLALAQSAGAVDANTSTTANLRFNFEGKDDAEPIYLPGT